MQANQISEISENEPTFQSHLKNKIKLKLLLK